MKIKSLLIAVAALLVSVSVSAQDAVNDVKKMYNEALLQIKKCPIVLCLNWQRKKALSIQKVIMTMMSFIEKCHGKN